MSESPPANAGEAFGAVTALDGISRRLRTGGIVALAGFV